MTPGGLDSWLRDLRPYRNAHLMRRALDTHRGQSVLDVGGATGKVEARLGLDGATVVDVDAGHLARARDRGLAAVRGRAGDLPFADGAFDRIVLVRVVHHLPDPEADLAEIVRVLADDGRIVVEEVIPSSLFGRALAGIETLAGHDPTFLAPREMKTLLERIGLDCKVEKWSPRAYAAIAVPEGTREPTERPGALA